MGEVEDRQHDPCCASDGGRPSGLAVQAGSPNRRSVMSVKSRGGKRLRKRPATSGSGARREDEHVRTTADASSDSTMTPKPGASGTPGTKARPWWCVLSQGATCVLPWRCPVYRWRELVAGAGMEQENLSSRYRRPVEWGKLAHLVDEREDPKRQTRKGQSTDARHRDGPVRSSDEGAVMALERRGRAGQVTQMPTRCWGRS